MNQIWIAVNPKEGHLHVLEHEGDYKEDDILVNIKPGIGGVTIRYVSPEEYNG